MLSKAPVRDGLKKLGLLGSHKVNGIPKDYRDADQSVTAPLLAGLFNADGCMVGGDYSITQVVDPHERLIRHAGKMSKGMGMRVSMNPYTPKDESSCPPARFSTRSWSSSNLTSPVRARRGWAHATAMTRVQST